jgi:hypothetical protein
VRSQEIRQAILDRLHAMAGEDGVRDIEYLHGLEEAVSSGVDYGVEIVARGGVTTSQLPLPVLTQARLAARHRIPLKLVIRRYLAAKTVLNDFVLRAASERPEVGRPALHSALAAHNAVFDQLVTAVSDEYEHEESTRSATGRSQHADLIQRLLRGEPADGSSLDYALDAHHLGLVVLAPDPQPLLRSLSSEVNCRLLMVRPSDSATWAWVGGNRSPDLMEVSRWASENWPASIPLGIGEAAPSLSGWRRTHNQARAAASLSHLTSQGHTKYRDIALLSAVCRDPLLIASVRDMYLAPLGREGDRGAALRATLRAYFDANRNSSCAAAALGVTRQTISKRLQVIEERLEQPITTCGDLLNAALQLEEHGAFDQLDNR